MRPIDYDVMKSRVRALLSTTTKSAADASAGVVPEKDPAAKGEVSAKKESDSEPSKQNLPASKANGPGKVESTLNISRPTGSGESGLSAKVDGNAKEDAATSPTTPLDKIATIVARLKDLRGVETPAAATSSKSATTTEAAANDINLQEPDFVAKMAHHLEQYHNLFGALQATEEGMEVVESCLRKQAGAEAARTLLEEAMQASQFLDIQVAEEAEMAKQAAEQQHAIQLQQAQEDAIFESMWKQASEKERENIIKTAQVHAYNLAEYDNAIAQLVELGKQELTKAASEEQALAIAAPFDKEITLLQIEKQAYEQGTVDAADMLSSGPEGAEPAPEEAMLPGAGADEAAPASIDEIMEALAAMVASGEVSEEDAAAVAQILASEEEVPPAVKQASAACESILN
jgi:hypothetical protein